MSFNALYDEMKWDKTMHRIPQWIKRMEPVFSFFQPINDGHPKTLSWSPTDEGEGVSILVGMPALWVTMATQHQMITNPIAYHQTRKISDLTQYLIQSKQLSAFYLRSPKVSFQLYRVSHQPRMLTSTQQIFKSLNCPECDTPFSKTAGAKNTPTQTSCHAIEALCMGCYKRKIDRGIRVHKCGRVCFDRVPTPSYYLMELLSSRAFKLDQQGKGYVQTTQSITIPECPVCEEEYSLRDPKNEPCSLHCGHIYSYDCPLCQANGSYSKRSWKNRLKTLLRELDEKSTQKEAEMKRICEDCRKEVSLLEMFQCMDCGDKMLCPRCSCKNHRLHQIIDLEVVEVKKLGKVTRETIIPQIEAYNVCFPELQSNLIKNLNECQEKILSRTDQLGNLNGFAEAKEQQKACVAFGERFETICEKYLGELRSFNTGIEKLVDDINESPK
ncbi:unnamed protein product, partial [Mesorhabditis belari]|uniref:Uncharacterized protein n=1 Tax=Mesorhabditis belari TaxID=2138241 RepID=A0AAF3EXR5_9BILA